MVVVISRINQPDAPRGLTGRDATELQVSGGSREPLTGFNSF